MPDATTTEFTHLDPEEMHLVKRGATGFPVLLAKAAEDEVGQVAFEEAAKGLSWEEAHEHLSKEIGDCHDEWVLKFVSAADRRQYAKSGIAMPNGDFPIPDEGHLRSAVGHLGNYTGDTGAAKAHIIKRARALGLTHLLPEDWNVSKDTVSTSEAEGQTRAVSEDVTTGTPPEPGDGGEPRHVAAEDEHVVVSDGTGDTAPDKALPKGEAASQTAGAQKGAGTSAGMGGEYGAPGGEVDGGGTVAGAGGDAAARNEAETQTDEVEKGKSKSLSGSNPAAGDPGSPDWEQRDVALGERAEALVSQLGEVVHTFTEREKAEGGGAAKSAYRPSGKTEGSLRRCAQVLKDLLDNIQPDVSKEIEVDRDELIKLLDERDAARREAKKAKKKGKMAPEAPPGEGGEGEAAKGAEASKAAAGAASEGTVEERLAKAEDLLAKMAGEDGDRRLLNAAGVTAALRGSEGPSVLKALEDRLAEAKTPEERQLRQQQLTAAKMIANDNLRARDPDMMKRERAGLGVPLLTNRHELPEDRDIRGI